MNTSPRRPRRSTRTLGPLVSALTLSLAVVGLVGCSGAPDAPQAAAAGSAETKPSAIKAVDALLEEGAPLRARWALDLNGKTASKIWLPPAGSDINYLLVLTKENDLVAIRRQSGTALWWTKLEHAPTGDPFFTRRAVYFISRSHLVTLERASGQVLWRVELPFPPAEGPVVYEEGDSKPAIFIPALDQRVYGVEVHMVTWPPSGGAAGIMRKDFVYEKPVVRIIWRYPTFGFIGGKLAIGETKVFAADSAANVYGIVFNKLAAGKPSDVKRFRSQGPNVTPPIAVGPYVLFASRDHNLYCLNRGDMSEVWTYPSGHRLTESPYALVDPFTNRTLIVQKCGKSGPLTGLNDTDGRDPVWELDGAKRVVARFGERENELEERSVMVVANDDETLSAHFTLSGKEIWRTSSKPLGLLPINTTDAFVYSTVNGGRVLCALEWRK